MGIDFDDLGLALERGVLVPNHVRFTTALGHLNFGEGAFTLSPFTGTLSLKRPHSITL
jgi:hypothetical protein